MKQIYVVGIGPGEASGMTLEASETLKKCDLIVGYTVYVELVKPLFPEKEFLATGMMQELDRCRMALKQADEGKSTAVVCSGDAQVYGMAGILFELAETEFPQVEIQVVAGVTAALSGGAVLGAPLGHDFAVISLSDLLTPWETIEKRIRLAAEADFCICLYNPSSKKRKDYLRRACDILLEHCAGDTVCGYVCNIGREGQRFRILSLSGLREEQVDMFTTVFVGNSRTRQIRNRMVTPRGYRGLRES